MHFSRRRGTYARVVRGSAVAIVTFVLAFVFTQWWDFTIPAPGRAEYQAVFLTNGQTYFGRFFDRIGSYAKIEDVYYIQQGSGADGQPSDARVIRRGSELHAPEHRMLVPKNAIAFVEDLRPDSPIAQFMRQDKR